MIQPSIAVVGMACIYPDAKSPAELWENVLAQRRSFRRIPGARLRLEDYFSEDPTAPDRIYASQAALIQDYEFDRLHFRVSGTSYRSADLTHWLALDIAERAFADAGFSGGQGLPQDMTGVILGNTLTGEFSRSNVMRLRWPYVRRVVEASLKEQGYLQKELQDFLLRLEEHYKSPFPPVNEESLAGSLANTIAGRICNYYDLKGGGYTVDGACASSLLSVITACSGLLSGDIDLALAGGVDLSIDPFELVGFAKAGALSFDEMSVYDTRSSGFWPGEGCGMVVLMREEDARAQGKRIYAIIRGWGISSDGKGGLTRPEVDGQILALKRAYRRAGISPGSVLYFEGHGTGTNVGDATELQTINRLRNQSVPAAFPAAIGSIKANIGHTKAAAGVAGLIKTVLALHDQILPPTTGCNTPHPQLLLENATLRVLKKGEPWPPGEPLLAGVSAMGFGGINTHIVLEGIGSPPVRLGPREQQLFSSYQDAELFLISASDIDTLAQQVEHIKHFAAHLSKAELSDLAAEMARLLTKQEFRAAVIATSPAEFASRLQALQDLINLGETNIIKPAQGLFLGNGIKMPRIGFLFPGQASPVYPDGGALQRRFPFVDPVYQRANLSQHGKSTVTEVAQPAIVAASLAGIHALHAIDIEGDLAIGHSLGEIAGIYWAGGMTEEVLQRTAEARGRIMEEQGDRNGAMASIQCSPENLSRYLRETDLEIACLNSPLQTIISGKESAVELAISRAHAEGVRAIKLPVSRAFHSSLMAGAVNHFSEYLASEAFHPLQRSVISTITGKKLDRIIDLRSLLLRQLMSPVRFSEAILQEQGEVDLWIEVGPGRTLSGLMDELNKGPVIPLDVGGPSIMGLLQAAASTFVMGGKVNIEALFFDRFTRPFNINHTPTFFANPCEMAPLGEAADQISPFDTKPDTPDQAGTELGNAVFSKPQTIEEIREVVRNLISQRTELPATSIHDDDRMLSDLHLNSIMVSQLIIEAAGLLQAQSPVSSLNFADATAAQIAQALYESIENGSISEAEQKVQPPGVDSWVRAFRVELVEQARVRITRPIENGKWQIFAQQETTFVNNLREAFSKVNSGSGYVLCLPETPDESCLQTLLEVCKAAVQEKKQTQFVLVQSGGSAASVARTLHLEANHLNTCVVDVPYHHANAVDWVLVEALSAEGYHEVHYDASGHRRVPVLKLLSDEPENPDLLIGTNDVILVTGGGKGITAELALSIALQTGASMALFGRSLPEEDATLANNLQRFSASGVRFRYFSVDIIDQDATRKAVEEVESIFGPVTGVLHGAARNEPKLLHMMTVSDFQEALQPKLQGLENLLTCFDMSRLRICIIFGSIISRTGLPGEAGYGLANEWLVQRIERLQREHPACRWLAIEWSVWSGVGMGERLSSVEKLSRIGVTPIPPDVGISMLNQLLSCPPASTAVIVTGRFGNPPTLQQEKSELPFLRFLEQPRAFYPGIELICDAQLSLDTDPYLADHMFHGDCLFPAAFGLEAMAQVAMALAGETNLPSFQNVNFNFLIIVPRNQPLTIRIAALITKAGEVSVVIRCAATSFQVNHIEALCSFNHDTVIREAADWATRHSVFPALSMEPAHDLYGPLLFHTGRFQRIKSYHYLNAGECAAQISSPEPGSWFGRFLPMDLVLPDPGRLDAAIHVIQACIPQAEVLPVGIKKLTWFNSSCDEPWTVHARERYQKDDLHVYDVEVLGPDSQLVERWESLQLKRVGSIDTASLAAPLLGPYLERELRALIPPGNVKIAVDQFRSGSHRDASDKIIQRVIGSPVIVHHRPDGKPEVANSVQVSNTHAGNFMIATAANGSLGCDLEAVAMRPESLWADLLGKERYDLACLITQQLKEDFNLAATRIWTAIECLRKAGGMENSPVLYRTAKPGGSVTLRSGQFLIATFHLSINDVTQSYVFSILTDDGKDKGE